MTAPSVTIEAVEAAILKETYTLLPNGRTMVCQLTLFDNGDTGFTVEGQSACVSKENFDHVKGAKYARQRALDKVWEMLSYSLAKDFDTQRKLEGETFKDRLLREQSQLEERITKLQAWFENPNFWIMSTDEREDQKQQHVAMLGYKYALDRRIDRLNKQN